MIIPEKFKAGDPAEGSDILVLLTYRLLKFLQLNLAGLCGQLGRMDKVLLESVQSLEKRRGKASRRSESSAGRDVGHARTFQVPLLDANQSNGFANDGMFYVINGRCFFEMGVFQQKVLNEALVNIDVNIFVDCRGNEKAAVLTLVGG